MAKRKYAVEPDKHPSEPNMDSLSLVGCIGAWLVTLNSVARYLDAHDETYAETGGARAIEDLYAAAEVMAAALRQHQELFSEVEVQMPPGIGWFVFRTGGEVRVKSDDLPF